MGRNKNSGRLRALVLVAGSLLTAASSAYASPIGISRDLLRHIPTNDAMQGIASFYDVPGLTSSGEMYDPTLFTAAIQIDLRNQIGGVQYGRKYRPVYGIAEYGGKRAVLKFNDVGPLRPGRKFDLSRAAMEYFGGIDIGLLPDFKVTMLPYGRDYTVGPLQEEVIEREVQELIEAEARQLVPTETIESIAVGYQPEELHSAREVETNHSALDKDDDIVTGTADLLDGSFDIEVFNAL